MYNTCCLDNCFYKRNVFLLFFFFFFLLPYRQTSFLLGLVVKQGNQGSTRVIPEADITLSVTDTGV